MTQIPPVQIGRVTTDSNGVRQDLVVGSWRLAVFSGDQDEPRIRDVDLAERLGYTRRLNIRDLIKKQIFAGKLPKIRVFRSPRKTQGGRPGEEFWLTESEALFIIAKAGTPIADEILCEVIEVFRLAIRGLLAPGRAQSAETRLALFLLDERRGIERFLSDKLIREISRVYGYDHKAGDRPPQFFRMVAERLYGLVFGAEVHGEMQARGEQRQYYQFLNDNAHRLAKADLDKIETLARQSFSPDEFWARVQAEYRGAALQGRLFA